MWRWIVVGAVFSVFLGAGVASGQPLPRSQTPAELALERQISSEVAAASPAAGSAFERGNLARDAQRFDEAVAAYREASGLAPGVDHPQRRMCNVLLRLHRIPEGVAACERARELAPTSPLDAIALAAALASRNGAGDVDRAESLAREALAKRADDPIVLGQACSVFLLARDAPALTDCSDRLLRAIPDDPQANHLGAIAATAVGQFDLAESRLERAKALGLDTDSYRKTRSLIEDVRSKANGDRLGLPVSTDVLRIAGWTMSAWLAAMLVLLGLGYALSRASLRAVTRAMTSAAGARAAGVDTVASPREQRLRSLYKIVLLASGLYFYLSMPILLAIVIVAGGGAIYMFFAIGEIPVKLVFIIGLVVIGTVIAIVRSFFVRVPKPSLGHRVDLSAEPKLAALIAEVASAVGTHPADAVYITPGVDMMVTEREGLWSAVRGKHVERSLVMGLGLFDGMTQVQLRSVLAHEHGHFRNADTAGGGFALAVRRSLVAMIIGLARAGVARRVNPAWWFLRSYYRVYFGISQGASRLQEVLADRWAIQAYGSAAFVAGYRHVIERSVRFDARANAVLAEVIRERRGLPNLYHFQPAKPPDEAALQRAIDEAMSQQPTPYDSHPSSRDRIAWAETLAVAREPTLGDDEPIWSLFTDREQLERLMTATIRDRVFDAKSVRIPDGHAAGADEATS